jgi:SRSO17 transposase
MKLWRKMRSPDQLCQKSAISSTARILENPTFARGFSACSLTQKPERSGGWRREQDSDSRYGSREPLGYWEYTGSAGKNTNCQIGVFAAYVSRHGHAFIDRTLYLPKEWTDDPDRLEAAYVSPDAGFATKPKLATRMIARAIAASVPFKWVAGDTIYGVGDIEQQLRQAGKGSVLGVSSAHVFQSWGERRSVAGKAADIAWTRRPSDWKRLSAGAGTKGPRLHDWCYLELADLEVEEFNSAHQGLWTRGLLIRRHVADGDLAFFTTWCPAATSIETLAADRKSVAKYVVRLIERDLNKTRANRPNGHLE